MPLGFNWFVLLKPFTYNFPRADIHEIIMPDLLHQVFKGASKDHLVEWVMEWLIMKNGEACANGILDDIDSRKSAYPDKKLDISQRSPLWQFQQFLRLSSAACKRPTTAGMSWCRHSVSCRSFSKFGYRFRLDPLGVLQIAYLFHISYRLEHFSISASCNRPNETS